MHGAGTKADEVAEADVLAAFLTAGAPVSRRQPRSARDEIGKMDGARWRSWRGSTCW
jgi:hypothetical protein